MTPVYSTSSERIGAVVIGRNEGERLVRCLRSIVRDVRHVVYVDSGSTDASVREARASGTEVVELDMSTPFTAARARNAGFHRLCELTSLIKWVQFVDGDCEMVPGWIQAAASKLEAQEDVAAVCGRLRERDREATVYNLLCDIEWHRPTGCVDSCGGIVMIRRSSFERVGGFDEALIAGEEPELCVRIRASGERVWRLPDDMAIHDAAMTRFGQWWRRTKRCGWAYAASAAIHGSFDRGRPRRTVARALLWGILLPFASLATVAVSTRLPAVILALAPILLLYAAVIFRSFRWSRAAGETSRDALLYAIFCTLGKPAEALGVLQYWSERCRGANARLIEYK